MEESGVADELAALIKDQERDAKWGGRVWSVSLDAARTEDGFSYADLVGVDFFGQSVGIKPLRHRAPQRRLRICIECPARIWNSSLRCRSCAMRHSWRTVWKPRRVPDVVRLSWERWANRADKTPRHIKSIDLGGAPLIGRCQASVNLGPIVHGAYCTNRPKYRVDGKGYCGIHHKRL